MIQQTQGLLSLFQKSQAVSALIIGAVLAALALIVGILLAVIGPIYTTALLFAMVGGIWVIADMRNALWSIVAIIAILPYATLPFKIVITPTFLDLVMGAFFFLYLGEWMTGYRRRLHVTPVHGLIVLFMVLSIFSFVAGLRYAGISSTVARRFAEFQLSMVFAMLLSDVLNNGGSIKEFALVLMILGGGTAILAIVFWVLPDDLAGSILRRLSVIGYPDAGIIRYVEENPDLPERAIATSADPNALGGFLVMMAALVAPQALAKHRIAGKAWHVRSLLALIVVALILTFSRGSLLAFGAALIFIAALRYQKLLIFIGLGALLFLVLPWTQFYVIRLVEGFQGADLATQMRFGEYRDAFTLISRYPLLGVGFTGTPDIDIYLGVANVYLTIASNMGLVGLAAFLILIAAIFWYAWTTWIGLAYEPVLRPIQIGLLGGIVGSLANGVFDHYFFNLDFHPAVTIMWLFMGMSLAVSRQGSVALEKARLQSQFGGSTPPVSEASQQT